MTARRQVPPAAAKPAAAVRPEYWNAACGTTIARTPPRGGPPASSKRRGSSARSSGPAGYHPPAGGGPFTPGARAPPAETAPRPPPGGPRPLNLGPAEAAWAAHDLHHVEEPEIARGHLVITPPDGRLGDRPRVEEVVPNDVVRAGVAGLLDCRAAATAAPRGRLVDLD